ncbi:Phage protein [Candidatus Rhodobacter oscarellae]|uniref:Phage protein n=1 Tax=Candidatus Rhodobacter oscarellae TaxID=1675527 RepID=A0A0J9E290_9RHOB|nr:DUF3168 domain-containing protein [Candidatus Rhodobacter lobularis]KMW56976.1 Phage protein [Candidatus Rhodobacter lobularis]
MTAPDVELQGAIVAAVEVDAGLMALIGGIYDGVPEDPYGAVTAYVSFGPSTMDLGEFEGLRAEKHVVQLDVWSRAVGRVECKDIVHRLKHLFSEAVLPLDQNAFVRGHLTLSRIIPDPKDGVTHAILQFEFELEDQT